jgi:hypothetical protein
MGLLHSGDRRSAARDRTVSHGPRLRDPADAAWPRWRDRISERSGSTLIEGGRRMKGHLKTSSSQQPLVTYVTVVRNQASTLGRAIESVQRQTYPAVEHVILDGASTDATLDVIQQYSDRLDYFASQQDDGLYEALNKAIPLAYGDLICVLNSDDWLEPNAAEVAVVRLEDVKAPALILTAANARQPKSGVADPPILLEWFPARVHEGSFFTCADDCHNGVYATRSAYERSGPYDTSYEIAADFKWLMSCFESGVQFVYSRDITVNYVFGGASSDAEKHGFECVRALRERFPTLTLEEAGGLYHSFFAFPTFPSVPGRPDNRSHFLCQLLSRHSDDPDLLMAIASALIADEDRRQVAVGERITSRSTLSSVKERVKLMLEDHPATYQVVRRLYAGMRRV